MRRRLSCEIASSVSGAWRKERESSCRKRTSPTPALACIALSGLHCPASYTRRVSARSVGLVNRHELQFVQIAQAEKKGEPFTHSHLKGGAKFGARAAKR